MSTPITSPRRKPLVIGPGTLTLGEIGTPLDMSCQLTNIVINPESDSEDAEPTLCGGSLPGDSTWAWTLTGTVAQDLEKDGVIDWTWKHKGKEVPFEFTPQNDVATTKVNGTVIVDPLALGGDVGKRGMSEFEWTIVGDPDLSIGDDETVPVA